MGIVEPRCGLCQRPLRDPASIELGFGPDCWSRLDATARRSVLEARPETASVPTPAPASPMVVGSPGRRPALPASSQRSVASPLAVAGAWAVVLAAVVVLLEYWRVVLVGVALVAVVAALGLLVERVQHRRPVGGRARR